MPASDAITPRWGNALREEKARAIVNTLTLCCGPEITHGAWLDAGCGSGGIAAGLAQCVDSITGVDPEPWDAWGTETDTYPNLTFSTGYFDRVTLPVAEESFDVVICNQVYEHVSDPEMLLKNIYRALKCGGTCYFAGPNLLWPVEPHVFLPFVHWLPRKMAHSVMRLLGAKKPQELDAYSKTAWTLRRWFRDNGFEVRNAVQQRVIAGLPGASDCARAKIVRRIPGSVFNALLPVMPGFVFILRKRESA